MTNRLARGIGGCAIAIIGAFALVCVPAFGHGMDPRYESRVVAVSPVTPGLTAEIDSGSSDVTMTNDSRHDVVVEGYGGEPYLRFDRHGAVFVNMRSPAHYLNEDKYAEVELPAMADKDAVPAWRRLASDGRYSWHDHRTHWMSRVPPTRLNGTSARATIFDWSVPIVVGDKRGRITGRLDWLGEPTSPSQATTVVLAGSFALTIVVALAILFRRRRRRGRSNESDPQESW